jgi:hypothetical protein
LGLAREVIEQNSWQSNHLAIGSPKIECDLDGLDAV